jgi:hypothetical protein
MKPTLRVYSGARMLICEADMLLFRRIAGDLESGAIALGGRSIYSHVGMAGWWCNRLLCLEMISRYGCRAVRLSQLVERYPGRIDVYPAQSWSFDRELAVRGMVDLLGRPYGWWTVFKMALTHAPIVRWFMPARDDDESDGGPWVCSSSVSRAYRQAGLDPVPNLADRATEPGDLARSAAFSYRFTLVPDAPLHPAKRQSD